MRARRDVYYAIADPTRREIISLIAAQPFNVNSIAEQFDMTRQAVSLHVNILEECGLVTIKKQGRERVCEAKLAELDEVEQWITQSRKLWTRRFDKLESYITELKAKEYGDK